MLVQPPYALAPPMFRHRALAALAGRLPLGGERELAMAAFVAARLAGDAIGSAALSQSGRAARAHGPRLWGRPLPLPTEARSAFTQLCDATVDGSAEAIAMAMDRLIVAVSDVLDPRARAELRLLVISARAVAADSPAITAPPFTTAGSATPLARRQAAKHE